MINYTMTEKQDLYSQRENVTFEAKNLTAAKRKASSLQAFYGTIISLEQDGYVVAVKEKNGKWIPNSFFNE